MSSLPVTRPSLRNIALSRLRSLAALGLAVRAVLTIALVLLVALSPGPAPETARVAQLSGPLAFRLLDWELAHLAERAGELAARLVAGSVQAAPELPAEAIPAYFQGAARARELRRLLLTRPDAPERTSWQQELGRWEAERAGLARQAEQAITADLERLAREEGLLRPMPLVPGGAWLFPPVSFVLTPLPQALVVSPRDRIALLDSRLLRPELDDRAIERLEERVESGGLAAAVLPLGGLSTYPAMVAEETPLRATLTIVAHEWLHAYFFFAPLGQAYGTSYAMRTINETAAELAGAELGDRLYARYHQAYGGAVAPPPLPRDESFNRELRAIRETVERLLADGRVEEAEAFMRERREWLLARGLPIRRLNQAYLAFYGSYGFGSAGVDPLVESVHSLRRQSASVGAFVRRIAEVDSPAALAAALREQPGP